MNADVLPAVLFRGLAACALLAAAVAHIPVTPDHLREAPYMGAAFIAFSVIALLLAGGIAVAARPAMHIATMALCGAAITTYAMTRMVAFPQLSDDVGNWSETLGVISVASEMIAIVASAIALALPRRTSPRPSAEAGDRMAAPQRPYFA